MNEPTTFPCNYKLVRMSDLTLGDFIAVQRRLKVSGKEMTGAALDSALVHEVACKNAHKGRLMGFQWAN